MSLQSQYQTLEMANSNMMQPELIPVGEAAVTVNASQGATVRLGNIVAIVRPGTCVEIPSGLGM